MKRLCIFTITLLVVACSVLEKRSQPSQEIYSDVFNVSIEELDAILAEHILKDYPLSPSEVRYSYLTTWIQGDHTLSPSSSKNIKNNKNRQKKHLNITENALQKQKKIQIRLLFLKALKQNP